MLIEEEDEILPILVRYLQGEVSNEEKKYIADWRAKSKLNQHYFTEMSALWTQSEDALAIQDIDLEAEWNRFETKVNTIEKRSNATSRYWIKIAATVLVLLGLGFWFNQSRNPSVVLLANQGKNEKFVLPDQSIVWLKNGSELRYKKEFLGTSRLTTLKGEAFFEIVKNPNKPFVVLANNTRTAVLGTSFNLSADSKSQRTELVLVSGKVSFSTANENEILTPGQSILAKPNTKIKKSPNTDPNFLAWKTRILTFEKTALKKVISDLNIFYGTKFILENKALENCTLTAKFKNEPISEILETFAVLFETTSEKTIANTYRIKGGSCAM